MPQVRQFLLIALLAVGFLLWQAWETDHRVATAVATAASTAANQPLPGDAAPVPPPNDVPAPNATPAAGSDAVPAPTPESPEAPAAARDDSVRVTVDTDVLHVVIDTTGASVVSTSLLRYPITLDPNSDRVQLLDDSPQHYFVAQSGWVGNDGRAPDHRARYQTAAEHYRLAEGQDVLEVAFTHTGADGLTFTKRYRFHRGQYAIDLVEQVHNGSAQPWQGNAYRQLQRTAPAGAGSFSLTNPQTYSFVGAAWYSPDKHFEKLAFDAFAEEPLSRTITGGWAAMLQHYFFAAWIPPVDQPNTYATKVVAGPLVPRYLISTVGPATTVAPGASSEGSVRLYLGPKLQQELPKLAEGLALTIDYGYVTLFAEPLFWLLAKLHALTGNWGAAIILLVVLIKLAFYKLSEAQYRSMAKMRKLQPRLVALKERYGDDKEKYNQAMLELYQKEKVNPMGGCLPVLVTIPVFIALYWVLVESVELRQAPFYGWIKSLTDQDPYFILPVLNAAVMIITQRMTPMTGMDPTQQKMMQLMPVVFSVMFAFFPAGLVLYWTVNGVLSLAQQWVIMKRVDDGTAKA